MLDGALKNSTSKPTIVLSPKSEYLDNDGSRNQLLINQIEKLARTAIDCDGSRQQKTFGYNQMPHGVLSIRENPNITDEMAQKTQSSAQVLRALNINFNDPDSQ